MSWKEWNEILDFRYFERKSILVFLLLFIYFLGYFWGFKVRIKWFLRWDEWFMNFDVIEISFNNNYLFKALWYWNIIECKQKSQELRFVSL